MFELNSSVTNSRLKVLIKRIAATSLVLLLLVTHEMYFPETQDMLQGELIVWRGLPTAFGRVLMTALALIVIVQIARLVAIYLMCRRSLKHGSSKAHKQD